MNLHRKSRLLTVAALLVVVLCGPLGDRVPAIGRTSVDLISGDQVPVIVEESIDLLSGDQVPASGEESIDLLSKELAPRTRSTADQNGLLGAPFNPKLFSIG
jgi:hypothetical protein